MTIRILIVEDHPTMREAMRLVLEHEGFSIHETGDGQTALQIVKDQQPDLVFLDLNIPGVPGVDVLRAIKQDPATARVRVIIVTATGEDGRAESCPSEPTTTSRNRSALAPCSPPSSGCSRRARSRRVRLSLRLLLDRLAPTVSPVRRR